VYKKNVFPLSKTNIFNEYKLPSLFMYSTCTHKELNPGVKKIILENPGKIGGKNPPNFDTVFNLHQHTSPYSKLTGRPEFVVITKTLHFDRVF